MNVDERMNALLHAELDARERALTRLPQRTRQQPWTTEDILRKLERSVVFVERALTYLYAQQTTVEQAAGSTQEENGVGFNQYDAPFLSSLARQIAENTANTASYYHAEGRRLSPRQVAAARLTLRKYAGQLAARANQRTAGTGEPAASDPAGDDAY